jgi:hypothetical protein
MRDLQRLEELSSTAALGLWADDVVLALYRVAAGSTTPADASLLRDAAAILDVARERVDSPLAPSSSARALLATDAALSVVSGSAGEHPADGPTRTQAEEQLLGRLAAALRAAADGRLTSDTDDVDDVVVFFSAIGERQLVESNSVLASRKDAAGWTVTPPT